MAIVFVHLTGAGDHLLPIVGLQIFGFHFGYGGTEGKIGFPILFRLHGVKELFILTDGNFVAIEFEVSDMDRFLARKIFTFRHLDRFVAELTWEVGDESPVEDTNKKSEKSDGGNRSDEYYPFPSDASPNGFLGRFNFFLANVNGLDSCELTFEVPGSAHEIEGRNALIA